MEPQLEQRNATETARQAVGRADSIVSRALQTRAGRWATTGAVGLAATAGILLTGCSGGGNVESVHTAETTTPVAMATPQVETTNPAPTPERKLSDQEIDEATAQLELTRSIIKEFIGDTPIIKTYRHSDTSALPPVSDFKNYLPAVEHWARGNARGAVSFFGNGKDERGNTEYILTTGLDGTLGYSITNEYNASGQYIGSTLDASMTDARKFDLYPELAKLRGGPDDTYEYKNAPGTKGQLLFKLDSLPDLARLFFKVPDGATWQPTSMRVESGSVPGIQAEFNSSQGPARIRVGGNGVLTLEVIHTPSFVQTPTR